MRIDHQSCEKQRVIKATNILEYTNKGIDLPLVNVVLLVHLEVLRKEFTLSRPLFVVRCEILIVRSLVEIISFFSIEQTEIVIFVNK